MATSVAPRALLVTVVLCAMACPRSDLLPSSDGAVVSRGDLPAGEPDAVLDVAVETDAPTTGADAPLDAVRDAQFEDTADGAPADAADVSLEDISGPTLVDASDVFALDASDASLPGVPDAPAEDIPDAPMEDAPDASALDASDAPTEDIVDVQAVSPDVTVSCPAGQTSCGGTCVVLDRDVSNCGACGSVCSVPNARGECLAGACYVGACNPGFGDCDGNAFNGCETEFTSASGSPNHCGSCGNRCPTPPVGAMSVCRLGRCEFQIMCPAGLGDCDGNSANGCETTTATSVMHCGTCGATCGSANGTATCAAGACRTTCNAGYGECDGNAANGCETDLIGSLAHCGRCGNACPASARCVTGACVQPRALALNGDQSCARLTDGTVRCWGDNSQGQLGDGTRTARSSPTAVPMLNEVTDLAAGYQHTCARLTDGTLRCWGDNSNAALGDGSMSDRLSPTSVSALGGVLQVVAGSTHTCARLADGTARCWGENVRGQIGDGTRTGRLSPTAVSMLSGVAELSSYTEHTCARMVDTTVRCWGFNADGQLGDGTGATRSTPTVVPLLTGVAELATADSHTCARMIDGTVRCWGDNSYGQLGDGTTMPYRLVPTPVPMLGGVAGITAGGGHTCARLTDGTARCWGRNSYGALGDGTTVSRRTPVAVPLSGINDIVAGDNHTCARLMDGTFRCWGLNRSGQVGDGTNINRPTPTAVRGL